MVNAEYCYTSRNATVACWWACIMGGRGSILPPQLRRLQSCQAALLPGWAARSVVQLARQLLQQGGVVRLGHQVLVSSGAGDVAVARPAP